MSEVIEFPFDSGAYEAADKQWLPANLLAVVENMRLDLDGRLGVRPGNTALPTTTYSPSALVAYDLANYNGRLIALGDQCSLNRPTDLFEYVNTPAAAWRASAAEDDGFSSGPRIPRATNARDIGRIPDSATDVFYVSAAAVSVSSKTYVMAVHQLQSQTCRVHVFIADTDQSLVVVTRPLIWTRVFSVGSTLWLVGQQTNNNAIVAHRFTPGADETLQSVGTLIALGAAVRDIGAAQTGASDFTIAYIPSGGGSVEAARFNSSGVNQSTFTAQAALTQAVACAVCGNSGGTLLSFSYITQSGVVGSYFLKTTNATGGGGVGPTALFAGATVTGFVRLAMTQQATEICICGMQDNGSTNDVATQLCTNQATNGLASTIRYANAFLRCGPVFFDSNNHRNWYYGCVDALAASSPRNEATNQLVEQAQRLPIIYKDATLAGSTAANTTENNVSSGCSVGTKLYWGNTIQGIAPRDADSFSSSGSAGVVTELEMNDTGRRQMTQVGNQLHIAGAMPLVYDGRALFEQGFAERPSVSLAQGAGGSLTLLGRYNVRVTWEVVDGRGNILRSQASDPAEIALTGANRTITATANTPHSLRVWPFNVTSAGVSVRVGFYCTTAGGANFFLNQFVTVSVAQFGDVVSGVLNIADTALQDNQVLYEQSQTPVSHVSPPPYKFAWQARERQIIGGLPTEETWTFSKLLFPSEPVEFAPSGRLGFSGRANQAVTAVGAFETVGLVWTKSEVQIIPGRGPEHNGTGEFDSPIRVPSPGGATDWRSVVDAPPGFFFQMAADKLMLVPRSAQSQGGAGAVTWIGQPVRQTLALFPVITGAVHVRSQMVVAFSCTNTAGDAGRILIYDLRREQWYVDTVGPATAISELDGRLAFILSNVVQLQDLAPGVGAMPACAVQTGIQPVTKRMGWGSLYKIGLLTLDSGACTIEAFIDYDDGAGFRSLGTETYTGTGNYQTRFWSLAIQKAPRYALRFVMTGGPNTLGQRLIAWAVEVEGSKNMVRVGSGGNVA